jgi:hypothetical protein
MSGHENARQVKGQGKASAEARLGKCHGKAKKGKGQRKLRHGKARAIAR